MKAFTLDGDRFDDLESFYDEVQRQLCPDFEGFGRNLGALNDVLRGGFGTFDVEAPIEIVWSNSARSRRLLGHVALARYLQAVREVAHASNQVRLDERIADAERDREQTLFEVIANLFRTQSHITLTLR